ncbi:probable G-protein coupled receptor 139 [Narcine bancroftii]|uniref:probable G-protein coupled receptor 139 n=1 Tax=Narcine bancroftii TaxID=1343680 RepID=UPI003831E951
MQGFTFYSCQEPASRKLRALESIGVRLFFKLVLLLPFGKERERGGIDYLTCNLLSIVVLSRGLCGLSKGVIRYMVTMAVADTMVCVFNVTVTNIFRHHFPGSFLAQTSTCRLIGFIQISSVQISVWATVSFTVDRFIVICCQQFKIKYCTERNATVVLSTVSLLSFLMNIPVYFRYKPHYTMDGVQWGCRTVTRYRFSQAWQTYRWLSKLMVPLVPLPLMLLLNFLTVRHILMVSKARRALKHRGDGEVRDPEMTNRRKSIILLFAISGTFIALWTPVTITDQFFQLTTFEIDAPKSLVLAIRIAIPLMYMSCCTNTFVYALTQRRFREEAKKMTKYPLVALVRLFKSITQPQ